MINSELSQVEQQIASEIKLLEHSVIERDNEIQALIAVNAEAKAKIQQLRDAQSKLHGLTDILAQIDSLISPETRGPAAKPRSKGGGRSRMNLGLDRIILQALAQGPKSPETIVQEQKDPRLKLNSVRTCLYRLAQHSRVERTLDGTWRLLTQQSADDSLLPPPRNVVDFSNAKK